MPIQSIWRCSHLSNMDVECSQWWCAVSTMTPQGHLGSAIVLPHFSKKSPPPMHRYNSVRVHTYAHPQHMKVLKYFCRHSIWMWNAVSGGLQPQPWHRNVISALLDLIKIPKFGPHQCRCNSGRVRVHPYTHPQHSMRALKLFVDIQYGCGMQSMGVSILQPQLWHHNKVPALPDPTKFPKFGPQPPAQAGITV